jgi:toxin CptA
MTSAPAIGFDYRPSRRVLAAGVAMGLLAVAVLLVSPVPAWIRWPGLLATTIYVAAWCLSQARSRVAAVLWHGDGSLTVGDAAGHERQATLVRRRHFAGVVLLDVRWQGGRQVLLLAPDNLPADTLRAIRIRPAAAPGRVPA